VEHGGDVQEKVEAPAARVAHDVGPDTAVETTPALRGLDAGERAPDLLADAAFGGVGRDLELDLEEIERVHAADGDDARTKAGKGRVDGIGREKTGRVGGLGHATEKPRRSWRKDALIT